MEVTVVPTDPQDKLKAYWDRPGGKFGILVALGLIMVAAYYVVPILTTMVWNTLNFGIALASLGLFLFVVTNRRLRLTLMYFWEILMRGLLGIVIELDPFVIAQDCINDMEKQRTILYQKKNDLDARRQEIINTLQDKEKEMNHQMVKAQTAKASNMPEEMGLAVNQAGRLKEYIEKMTPIREKLDTVSEILNKMYKNSAFLIEDAKNELAIKKEYYYGVTAGNEALTSALKIFEGDPEKKLMQDQAMESLKNDIASKLASMKNAIDTSNNFMKSIDLDKATYENEGLKMLESFDPDTQMKLNSTSLAIKQPEAIKVPGKVTDTYKNLLD